MKSNKTDKTVSKGCKEKRYHKIMQKAAESEKDCKDTKRPNKTVELFNNANVAEMAHTTNIAFKKTAHVQPLKRYSNSFFFQTMRDLLQSFVRLC